MSDRNRGGHIEPDGRPPQAKGVGKNSKRHDLERPATPGLHDSDLQQGDVQAMEQGQRIAPIQEQSRGQSPRLPGGGGAPSQSAAPAGPMQVPDAIDFLGAQQGGQFSVPQTGVHADNTKGLTWLPILRQLAAGPGASGRLTSAIIAQARQIQRGGSRAAAVIDMNGVDDAIETMTREV